MTNSFLLLVAGNNILIAHKLQITQGRHGWCLSHNTWAFGQNISKTARTGGKLLFHRAPPACSFIAIPNHRNLKQIRYSVYTYSCPTTVTGRLRCEIRTLQGDIVKPFIAHKLLRYRGCCLVGLRAGLHASKKWTTFCPCRESTRYQIYTVRIFNYFVLFVKGIGPVAFSNSETKLRVPTLLMPKPAITYHNLLNLWRLIAPSYQQTIK